MCPFCFPRICLQENQKQEHDRMQTTLNAKLEARKQRRRGAAIAAVEKNSQLDLDDERRRELDMDASQALLFGKTESNKKQSE